MTYSLRQYLAVLLKPTPAQLTVSIGLALLTQFIAYHEALLKLVTDAVSLPAGGLMGGVNMIVERIVSLPYMENSGVVLFWAALGTMVYVATLSINNSIIDARNNLVIQHDFINRGPSRWSFTPLLMEIVGAAATIGLLLISGLWLIPWWTELFGQFLAAPLEPRSYLWSLLGWAGMAANIYAVWMLLLFSLNVNRS